MSGAAAKKPARQKAKRSPARLAASKKAPANSAAFLAVPEKDANKTPPMTAVVGTRLGQGQAGEEAGGLLPGPGHTRWGHADAADVGRAGAVAYAVDAARLSPGSFQPALTVTQADGGAGSDLDLNEGVDVVPELAARRALAPGASVSESTLWDHVGLKAGLSVSSAAVQAAAGGKADKQ